MRDDETIGVDERALDDLALEALAEAHAQPPPPELRARVLEAARGDGDDRTRALGRSLLHWRIVGGVAAAVAVVLGGLLVRATERAATQTELISALAAANKALELRFGEQGRTVAALQEAFQAQAQVLQVLAGPRTLSASLAPQGGFTGGGRVVVDAETGAAAVVLTGLPAPGPGRTYELWAIRGDRPPEPAGLIAAREGPTVAARVDRIPKPDEVAAFAVSIEPAGGSKAPTGPIVLVGKVT
jgi:anti-sigma-K factor RskA